MDTRDERRAADPPPAEYAERGLGPWLRRNPWLLLRLFIVMVFTFGASTTAANFSYGLKDEPVKLSVEQLNKGRLPEGTGNGEFVEVRGTPDLPADLAGKQLGTPASRVGVSARYETTYLYYGLKQTGDNLLLQGVVSGDKNPLPKPGSGEGVFRGRLSNVRTVIFYNTTQEGLDAADLPHADTVPVIETGDTPAYYRQIFPAWTAFVGLWIASLAWLVWKRNKPFLGV